MYKAVSNNGNVFKSYNIQEIADIVTANKSLKFEFYADYKMLSSKEFVDEYFKETKNALGQKHLIEALRGKTSLYEIYNKRFEIKKCACCKRDSVDFYETVHDSFKVYYCDKHKDILIDAVYVYCTKGVEAYKSFVDKIL